MKEKMLALAGEMDVPEVIIATFTETKEDRFNSYRLMAKLFEITPGK